jgi:phosphatidylserine/phosphatidylglycerophosphate/cardiolipin synthase-like enzyme
MDKKNAKINSVFKIISAILIILTIFYNSDILLEETGMILKEQFLNENIQNEYIVSFNEKEELTKDIELIFCPSEKCMELFKTSFEQATNEIKCALYELDEENLAQTLLEKSEQVNISLIVDNNYLDEEYLQQLKDTKINIHSDTKRNTRFNNYMHSKFCVIDDETLIVGSANPTENGFFKNNNNILKIESKLLSKNYENEFDHMFSNKFGTNKISTLEYENITLNYQNQSYLISSQLS